MGSDPAKAEATEVLPLTDALLRTVDRSGGTFLHTSRTRPDRTKPADIPSWLKPRMGELQPVKGGKAGEEIYDLTDEVIRNLKGFGIDCLVAIGGDDTLGYGHTLSTRGFPVVGIPKTMDNDVRGTEYAIGFATALTRADEFINRQRSHIASSEVVGVFRIFGRNAGFTSLGTAMALSDIRCVIPEHRFDLENLCRKVKEDHERNEQNYALVICSEGAIWEGGEIKRYGPPDPYGHRKKANVGEMLGDAITRVTGLNTRVLAGLEACAKGAFQVLHCSGNRDAANVRAGYKGLDVPAAVVDFLPDIGRAYAVADLVLSRAGASTVAECAALRRPAVFVPYPWHKDRQQVHNAWEAVRAGAARIVEEADLDPTMLKGIVHEILLDPEQRHRMAEAAHGIARPEAAHDMAAHMVESFGAALAEPQWNAEFGG